MEALHKESDADYTLVEDHRGVWITVNNISVCITRTDEGVVVDLYGKGIEDQGTIATTYAHFAEAEGETEDEK